MTLPETPQPQQPPKNLPSAVRPSPTLSQYAKRSTFIKWLPLLVSALTIFLLCYAFASRRDHLLTAQFLIGTPFFSGRVAGLCHLVP